MGQIHTKYQTFETAELVWSESGTRKLPSNRIENNHLPTLRMIVYLIEFLNNSRFGITLNVQQLGNFRS